MGFETFTALMLGWACGWVGGKGRTRENTEENVGMIEWCSDFAQINLI